MILKRKKLEIRVTDEELEYGLGFMMDIGKDNNSWANEQKNRFMNKGYLGYKKAEGEFYFEDKRVSSNSRMFNADFVGYEIKNYSTDHIELRWITKTKSIVYMVIFFCIYLGVLVACNIASGDARFFIIAFSIILPLMIVVQVIKSIIFYRTAISDLKTTIETRVHIREYHRKQH